MFTASRRALTASVLVLALAGIAHADIVYLTNGQKVEGEVTDLGDKIRVRKTSGITVVYPKSRVRRIVRQASAAQEYRTRREKVELDDAKGLFELARWCAKGGLVTEAEAAFRDALAIASPVYRKAKLEFAVLLDKQGRLKEALALYRQLGDEATAQARSARSRLDRQRTIVFREAEERIAKRQYREAVGSLERAFTLTPASGDSSGNTITEAQVLARLSEARRLFADTFASSRLTIEPCLTCKAAGAVTCETCKGKGQVLREVITVSPTGGVRRTKKWERCNGCRGGKKVRCGSCRGVSADLDGLEGNLRNSLRLLSDRAFSSITSSVDTGIKRMNTWVLKNPLVVQAGDPPYASSRAMRDAVGSVPLTREARATLKGPWKGANAETRANFLACYGLELARLVAMFPQSALKPDRRRPPVPLEEAVQRNASLISAFPGKHSGGAFRVAGVWKGAPDMEEAGKGALSMPVAIETEGPHSLRPFLWLQAAKAVHAGLGKELGLREVTARSNGYPYDDLAKAAGVRKAGDRVELLGRFYYDDKPIPDWRFEVWGVSVRLDEETEKAVKLLSQRVTFRFRDTPIDAGLGMISDLTGVPIDADVPEGLALKVSARAKGLPLGHALGQLLKALELHWTLADGRVKVTSKISARERERVASILKLLPPAEASKK
jgi:tetratricopeptide (TPR) repeat protein